MNEFSTEIRQDVVELIAEQEPADGVEVTINLAGYEWIPTEVFVSGFKCLLSGVSHRGGWTILGYRTPRLECDYLCRAED